MIETLDHVIILVADIDEACGSYRILLGREPSWRGAHPHYGTRNALFQLENTYIELLTPDGPGVVADKLRASLEADGEGPIGLAFGTRDADEAHARFATAGLAPLAPSDGEGVDARNGARRTWRNVFLPEERTGGLLTFAIQHQTTEGSLPMMDPLAEPVASVQALDHVVIRTGDAEAAIGLLGEGGFGLRLALDKAAPEWGGRMLFFRVGGATVEVIAKLPPKSPPADAPLHRFWGIAYNVPDLNAAHLRLVEAGVEISEVRKGRKKGTRVATVKSHVHGVPTLLIGPE